MLAASALLLASDGFAYGDSEPADTALVFAIDASASIDEERFALQTQSISKLFRDEEVRSSIVAGPHHGVLVTLIQWSTHAFVSIPWTLITNETEATAFAEEVAKTPRLHDYADFTCVSVALQLIESDVLPTQPIPARRTVVDVSGNGIDNCSFAASSEAARDELVASGTTINGLPILEGEESMMLATWYRDHVIGGPGAFLIPAQGFADMERAMRKKFILEISLDYR